jgi:hypothetical protein
MLTGWKNIDENCLNLMLEFHKKLDFIEFYHSKIYCINDGFFYKVINNGLYIIKTSCISGNYSLMLYSYPLNNDDAINSLNDCGVTIRNSKTQGEPNGYGCEYLYDTTKYLNCEGSEYRKHRNIIKRYKTTFINGNSNDVADVVQNWSDNKKEKHQIKLYKTILKHLKLVNITTTYYKEKPIGISITEKINDKFGIICQRLINPIQEAYETKEPNFLLHYNDCLQNKDNDTEYRGGCEHKEYEIIENKIKPDLSRHI